MKNKIKAIIVDDESLSREKIRILAESNTQVEIIDEAKNFSEAKSMVVKLQPELLFLDINMPGKSGIELISELGKNAPFVIFTTAHSDYAAQAFNLNAVHYLLKPFDQQKFDEAVERASERISAKNSGEILYKIQNIISAKQKSEIISNKISIKSHGKIILVAVDDICFIKADKNYVVVNLKDKEHRMRTTLNELGEKLNPDIFIRVHKSFIVNRSFVQELEPTFNQEFIIKLSNSKKIPTGRAYKQNVDKLLK